MEHHKPATWLGLGLGLALTRIRNRARTRALNRTLAVEHGKPATWDVARGHQEVELIEVAEQFPREEQATLAQPHSAPLSVWLVEEVGPVSYTHLTLPTTPYV